MLENVDCFKEDFVVGTMGKDKKSDFGKCFVISAPSGAGKTTLMNKLVKDSPGIFYDSVSDTTREKRPGEVDGESYNFITVQEFKVGIDEGKYLEWADVHGSFYGTPEKPLLDAIDAGEYPLMILDIQGYFQLREKIPRGKLCGIFIFPPELKEQARRINERGKVDRRGLEVRLENSKKEMAVASEFKYGLRNDNFDLAYSVLRFIVEQEMES